MLMVQLFLLIFAEAGWKEQYKSSAANCIHGPNCRNGPSCNGKFMLKKYNKK